MQFFLFYLDKILKKIDSDTAIDKRNWYISRAPFKPIFLKEYARDISNFLQKNIGKVHKCIVLDCDNTLWGGIIGEDGINNIKLHPTDYPGNIFYQFQ